MRKTRIVVSPTNLPFLRSRAGNLTQQQLADGIGVSQGAIANWENGKSPISPVNKRKIRDFLRPRIESNALENMAIRNVHRMNRADVGSASFAGSGIIVLFDLKGEPLLVISTHDAAGEIATLRKKYNWFKKPTVHTVGFSTIEDPALRGHVGELLTQVTRSTASLEPFLQSERLSGA